MWKCYEYSWYQGKTNTNSLLKLVYWIWIYWCQLQLLLTYYISGPPAAAPRTPSVTFPIPGQQFNITWNIPPLSMGGTVDAYFVNTSGPDDLCGSVNTLHRFGNSTRSYTCSGWSPAGQKYTFTVQAANCGGSQRGPESSIVTVYLQSMLGHVVVGIIVILLLHLLHISCPCKIVVQCKLNITWMGEALCMLQLLCAHVLAACGEGWYLNLP